MLVIGFGSLLLTELITEAAFDDDRYYQDHGWPKMVAFLLAGTILGPLGQYLNNRGSKRLIDPETEEEYILKNDHSFFFIPMQYWSFICAALGIVFLFV